MKRALLVVMALLLLSFAKVAFAADGAAGQSEGKGTPAGCYDFGSGSCDRGR